MCKGETSNYCTCVGEGFQQESNQAYGQTNFKNVAMQLTQIDENHEGIAQIHMAVDAHDAELAEQLHDKHNGKNKLGKAIHREEQATALKQNWILGSHDKATTSSNIVLTGPVASFRAFQKNLNVYLKQQLPQERINESSLKIIPCKFIYLFYQSMENWNTCEDIAFCNPFFHGHPRLLCMSWPFVQVCSGFQHNTEYGLGENIQEKYLVTKDEVGGMPGI
ncbi:hypothetical protein K439DRAFT_1617876 [Ramaria rubella]|nr:hypothetical protein K439DRAFT_1617876 [Ramaria rubella]